MSSGVFCKACDKELELDKTQVWLEPGVGMCITCCFIALNKEIARNQEPLGEEFEKVWNENIEELYEE